MTRPSQNIDKKLLEAAKELLPETGFTRLSIRMVAKKAGVNLGMFNYHFKTKEAFIEQLLIDTYAEFFNTFTLNIKEGATPLEQLKKALFTTAVFARDNNQLISTLIEDVMLGNEKIIEFASKNMTKHVTVLVKLIKQCQSEGFIIKAPLFNIIPVIIAPIVAPNVVLALAERQLNRNIKLKLLAKLAASQILSDKAIKQRMDIVFKGLVP